ncbi:MAG: tetratricopeptide repeat protein, partial [Planctomycetaceae bacterium]
IKRDLLLTAMNGLDQINDAGGERGKDFVMAKAHAKMGESLMEIGEPQPARKQFQQSHDILHALALSDKRTEQYIHDLRLGRSFQNLGRAVERLQGPEAAREFYAKSLGARRKALASDPDPLRAKQEIAETLGSLGRVELALGRPREAMKYFEQSVAYRAEWLKRAPGNEDARREQAGGHLALGHGYRDLGEFDGSARHYAEALAILRELAAGETAQLTHRANAASCYVYLGTAQLFAGHNEQARKNYAEAVERFERLLAESPQHEFLLNKLGQARYAWGVVCERLNDPAADEHFRRSIELRRQLVDKAPTAVGYQQALMLSRARAGEVEQAVAIAEKLHDAAPKDPGVLFHVACGYALCAAAVGDAEEDGNGSAKPLREQYAEKAVETLRQAIDQGYEGHALLEKDPDLQPLHGRPDFVKLLDRLKER